MDQLLIQRTRYLLRSRFRRVQTCPNAMFVNNCKQLITWIENHPLLKFIIIDLSKVKGEHVERINKTFTEITDNKGSYDPGRYSATTNLVHFSTCYLIVKGISEIGQLKNNQLQFLIRCLGEYLNGDQNIKHDSNRSLICSKLSSGFHQISRYCCDFNVQEGFLVNFVSTSTRIRLELDSLDGFSYLQVGSKIIYYVEVNIADELSASKSGKASEIAINKKELILLIDKESELNP